MTLFVVVTLQAVRVLLSRLLLGYIEERSVWHQVGILIRTPVCGAPRLPQSSKSDRRRDAFLKLFSIPTITVQCPYDLCKMSDAISARISLPPEVWIDIISHLVDSADIQDLVHSWTECRHVSRLFQEHVEFGFSQKHLPYTLLKLDPSTFTS